MAAVLENSAEVTDVGDHTSHTLTFGFTATSGRLLIAAIAIDKNSGAITIPSGYTLINEYISASVSAAIAFKISDGTETSVAWSWVNNHRHTLWVGEYSGLAAIPLDVKAEADSGASAVTSQTSGTTAATAQADELAFGFWTADTGENVDAGRTYTNGFTEIAFVTTPGFGQPPCIIATKNLTATGTVESTFETSDTGDQMYGSMTTFKEIVSAVSNPWHVYAQQ